MPTVLHVSHVVCCTHAVFVHVRARRRAQFAFRFSHVVCHIARQLVISCFSMLVFWLKPSVQLYSGEALLDILL